MASLKIAAFALALLGSSMVAGEASAAMPVNGLTEATKQINNVQDVWWCGRWRCGPYWGYRRWWGPGPYYWRGGYGPGPYWGYRRCGWGRCYW